MSSGKSGHIYPKKATIPFASGHVMSRKTCHVHLSGGIMCRFLCLATSLLLLGYEIQFVSWEVILRVKQAGKAGSCLGIHTSSLFKIYYYIIIHYLL